MNTSLHGSRLVAEFIQRSRCSISCVIGISILWLLLLVPRAHATTQGGLTNGATALGTISVDNPSDEWTFKAASGQHILIRFGSTEFQGHLNLVGPDGLPAGPVVDDNPDVSLEFDAAATGTYTLDIFATSGGGDYQISFAQPGSPISVNAGDEGGPLVNGGSYPGSMPVGDVDVWSFHARTGDFVVIRLGTTNFDGRLSLYGPDGAAAVPTPTLGRDVEIIYTATADGDYTVIATAGYPNQTGTYQLSFAKPAEAAVFHPADDGGPMTSGERYTGTIDLGDLDQWTFTANAGDKVMIQFGATNFSGRLHLVAPDGTLAAPVTSIDHDLRITHQATQSGTYTVLVAAGYPGGIGEYRINIAQPGYAATVPVGDDGGALVNGDQKTGTIDLGDLDIWTFQAKKGDYIVARMAGTNLYCQLTLFNPDGSASTNLSGISPDVQIAFSAGQDGVYTLVADAGYPGWTGSYQLYFAKAGDPPVLLPGDDGGPISNGGAYNGTIDLGDLDEWTFTAKAGDYVTIQFGSTNFYGQISLVGPDGALATPTPGYEHDVRISFQASLSGNYTVLVSGYPGQTGAYRLYFVQPGYPATVPAGDDGGTLTNGGRHAGVVNQGDMDVWTFNAKPGSYVVLRMAATNLYCHLSLYGPDGKPAAPESNTDRDVRIAFTAQLAGVYTVVANAGYANSTGTYQLYYANGADTATVPPGDDGGTLANGQNYSGRIDLGDLDQWNFNATTGQTIEVRFGSAELSGNIEITDPNGALVPSTPGNGRDVLYEYTAVLSGTYRVLVSGGFQESGAYQLYFVEPGTPLTIPAGDQGGPMVNGGTYTGRVNLGDIDSWTFDASNGQSIAVRFGSEDFVGRLELFGQDGSLISFQNYSTDLMIQYAITNSGRYTVVVSAANYTSTGTYRLTFAQPGGPVTVTAGDDGGLLVNGGQYNGYVSLGDLDEWTFDAKTNETVMIRYSSVNLAGFVGLYNPQGAQVTSFGEFDRTIQYTVTNAGLYTVVVGAAQLMGTGAYQLQFSQPGRPLLPDGDGDGGPMANGGRYAGTLGLGDIDSWTFVAQKGEPVIVRFGSPDLRGHVAIYDPNGALITEGRYDFDISLQPTIAFDGTYTVVVENADLFQAGTYELYFVQPHATALVIPPNDEGGPLSNGGDHPGSIDLGDMDEWTFRGVAGEHVELRFGSAEFVGRLQLFDPSGQQIQDLRGDFDLEVDFDLAMAGVYTVVVSGNGALMTGHYRLNFAQPSNATVVPATALASGVNYDGVLDSGGLAEWTFSAGLNERVFLRAGSAHFTPRLTLYAPGGKLVPTQQYVSFDNRIEYTVTNAGLYTLVVDSWYREGNGAYRLRFAHPPESFVVPDGETGGGLTSETAVGVLGFSDQNLWRFTACEGDPIRLHLTSTNLIAQMELFGPDGKSLGTGDSRNAQTLTTVAPACGVYQVIARSYLDRATGTYLLTSNGRLNGPNLCAPVRIGADVAFKGVSASPGSSCIFYSTTNLADIPIIWIPFATNQFDASGQVNVTNTFAPEPPRYFRVLPGQ